MDDTLFKDHSLKNGTYKTGVQEIKKITDSQMKSVAERILQMFY